MSNDMYTILAMFFSYFFAALMLVIVFRAWRITVTDNRRAKLLRRWSSETGCIGQFLVNPGGKRQNALPILRECVLGSGRKADIRVKLKDVRKLHAHIEEREGGLLIRPLGKARLALGSGEPAGEQLFARDGDTLSIGRQRFLIVLFEPRNARAAQPGDTLYDESDPAFYPESAYPERMPEAAQGDDFFDEERLWR